MELNDVWNKDERQEWIIYASIFQPHLQTKTTQLSNDKGTWFGWEVSKNAPVTDTTLYNQAKTFSESIAKGNVRAKHGEDKPKESII